MITNWEASVLQHTATNGRYVTDEPEVITMADRGWLYNYGPQRLADGMHYLTLTAKGRAVLDEWRCAQPKPKRSRRSPAFQAWRDHCDCWGQITFKQFLHEIWQKKRFI